MHKINYLTKQINLQSNLHKEVTFGTKKKWPYKTGDLLKRFNFYETFYDRPRKRWPFNTGDCLKEVTAREGLTIYIKVIYIPRRFLFTIHLKYCL